MEIIKLNLIPTGVNPTCHCSQYDEGRVIRIELFDGLTPYTLKSGDTVTLNVRKPDNTIVTASVTATQGNNYVDIVTTEQICAVVGYNLCDLTITNGSVVIGTLNFIMAIERDVLADGIESQSVIEDLDALVQEAVGDNYYTKTETDNLLDAKADVDSVYTESETDTLLNEKANSIDVYTKDQVDTALEGKADVDGEYKLMTVGNAEQLKSSVGKVNKTPYNFRTSGGTLDIGDREVDKIVGGSVAFNQLASFSQNQIPTNNNGITYAYTDGTSVKCNGTATSNELRSGWFGLSETSGLKNNSGHRVIIITKVISGTSSGDVYFGWGSTPNKIGTSIISTVPSSAQRRFYYNIPNGVTCNDYIFTINVIDLTQMFGSTIAEYIYSLEQANTGAGVAYFRKLFPKPYYSYNAGELMSVKTNSHNMTGFNQWDEQWELGSIDSDGNLISGNTTIRSKNLIKVLPNTTYYFLSASYNGYIYGYDANGNFSGWGTGAINNNTFTTDSNTYFIRFRMVSGYGTTYNHDICINLSWDGERDGEYEPYELNSYPLDSDLELRGIPKLDSNNNLYYDGDIYESSGEVTRRFGIVNLGSLEWSYDTTRLLFFATLSNGKTLTQNEQVNAINIKYPVYPEARSKSNLSTLLTEKSSGLVYGTNCVIGVKDSTYNDADIFKASLNGVYLVYELETPTTEQADPFTNPQIVNDFGTEEYVDTRDVAIPVGHDTFYQANLKAKLEMAPDIPENNGDYLMRHNNGENTYIPYTSPIPSAPTEDGTYTLKVTVSGGTPTLTWVQDT